MIKTTLVWLGLIILILSAFYLKIVWNYFVFHSVVDFNIFHQKDIWTRLILIAVVLVGVFVWQQWIVKWKDYQ